MDGVIYTMTNPCFSGTGPVKMYKIGYTAAVSYTHLTLPTIYSV